MANYVAKEPMEIASGSQKMGLIRVLHVDDDSGFLQIAKEILELNGLFEVHNASSVEEAFEKISKEEYDAVVSDYQMSGKDGLEFLKELREKGNTIPFVIFTGKGREEVAIEALNLGANYYLNKAGSPETMYGELAHAIETAVRSVRVESALKASEERFRAVFEGASDGILGADPETKRLVLANPTMCKLTGYSLDELTKLGVGDIHPKKDLPHVLDEFEKQLKDEIALALDIPVLKKDGQVVYCDVNSKLVTIENRKVMTGFFRDTTERKKAEAEIRSLAKFPSENPFAVFRIDKKGTLLYANPSSQELLDHLEIRLGQSVHERWRKTIGEALESKCRLLFEEEVDGRLFSFSVTPIASEGYVNVYGSDITERKKAERTLGESEEKYRNLVELAPDGIVAVNAEGIVTSVNRSFLTLVGYDSGEGIVGKPFWELKTSRVEDLPKVQEMFKSLMKRESPSPAEFLYVRRDGASRWAEVHPSLLIKDGKPVGAQVIMRDTTDRKKAEEALKRSEVRFRDLAESIDDVFFAMDKEFRYTYWNSASEKLTGISAKDAIGKSLTEVFPEVKDTEIEHFYRNVLKTKRHQTAVNKYRVGEKDFIFEIDAYPTKDGISVFTKDISERKHMEETLRQSEEQFRQLFSSMPSGVAIYEAVDNGEDFVFKDFNAASEKIEKISKDNVLGKRVTQMFAGVKNFGLFEVFQRVWRTGEPEYFPAALYKDDRVQGVWRENWIYKLPNGNIIAIYNDITERKRAEENLRQSEEKYRGLFESTQDGIVISDAQGVVASANQAAAAMLGYRNAEELVNVPAVTNYADPEDRRVLFELLAKKGTVKDYEVKLKRKDGTTFDARITVVLQRDLQGNVLRAEAILRDITERKKMRNALSESEEKYRRQFEEALDAIFVADAETGILVDCNPAACELVGRAKSEIVGMHQRILHPPEENEGEFSRTFKEHLGKKKGQTLESQVITKSGEIKDVAIKANILTLGNKTLMQGVFRDVTERKKAEERLKENHYKMEMMNEKLRVVGALTRHDVRNKLSAVEGNVHLARKKLSAESEALSNLSRIESTIDQITGIFNFATAYERIGLEKLVYVDVEKAVEEAVSLFSDLQNVKISNDCHGLTVLADSLLNKLFFNLIDNSLKHGKQTSQIRIYYQKENGGNLRLVYEDDGVGIPHAEKPKLFNEGYSTSGGTGYGLYLIKKLTEVYGWTIQETGEPRKGAQFTITIPKKNQDNEESYQLLST